MLTWLLPSENQERETVPCFLASSWWVASNLWCSWLVEASSNLCLYLHGVLLGVFLSKFPLVRILVILD